jgi:phosphoserine phosphatase
MSASGGRSIGDWAPALSKDFTLLIARLIAETSTLASRLDAARDELAAKGWPVAMAEPVRSGGDAIELQLPHGDPAGVRDVLDRYFAPSDLLVVDHEPVVPRVFVSDMDSTMISAECIDELADFAGIKDRIAEITERAMQGELDFESALRERVRLLTDLDEGAIAECLATRIAPMPGARTLVATLKAKGCRTVLVTGGFHQFADPVAEQLGFERVVANRLDVVEGKLTGGLVGPITDSGVKRAVLLEEMAKLGAGATSLATGDGANDIPMIEAATYGLAYRAKPKARAAADGWIDRGDLTAILELLGIPREEWVWE